MLHLLSACCPCLRPAKVDDDYTVIPNEAARLLSTSPGLPAYSAGSPEALAVDTQKLNERLGTIVRAKGAKMVNVSARTPFVMYRAPCAPLSASNFASTPPDPPSPGYESAPAPRTSRRPPVLTMTPARASLYAESRYSSPAGSRSSSRRRPELPDRYGYANASVNPPSTEGSGRGTQASWFGESASASESEVEVEESAAVPEDDATPVPIPRPAHPPAESTTEVVSKGLGIAFSWSDT
ncbi:hypothetical protein FB451DRAFT_1296759 [Mycena latifolia]|nr:hypothetical protein FB451DRAFT_1296759 [Mycena latifolia]